MSRQGQATTEYILVLAMIVTFILGVFSVLGSRLKGGSVLLKPLSNDFAKIYQYGNKDVKANYSGNMEGSEMHPRVALDGNDSKNFRIFIGQGGKDN